MVGIRLSSLAFDVCFQWYPLHSLIWKNLSQDVFRVLFSSGKARENGKHKAVGGQAPALEQAHNARVLRAALKMCNTHFAEMDSTSLHRTPHFKAGHPTRQAQPM
jgi:hypothetical protein